MDTIMIDSNIMVDSVCTAIINAPIALIDIPAWCFTLPDKEYQACSPAHVAAGATVAPDGRRMSINVEVLGGSLMVQHYVEEIAQKDRLVLVSLSDLFMPLGRTTALVRWELSARRLDDQRSEYSNRVRSWATPEMQDFLGRQGIPLAGVRAQRQPIADAHNRGETPFFAAGIERAALANRPDRS